MRFFGIPAGYEFSTLVEDLLDLSTGTTNLSEKTRTALQEIDQDLHVQVFVTPMCPYCPSAARLAHKLAIENEHITSDVIEISEFMDLAHRYRVQASQKPLSMTALSLSGHYQSLALSNKSCRRLTRDTKERKRALLLKDNPYLAESIWVFRYCDSGGEWSN